MIESDENSALPAGSWFQFHAIVGRPFFNDFAIAWNNIGPRRFQLFFTEHLRCQFHPEVTPRRTTIAVMKLRKQLLRLARTQSDCRANTTQELARTRAVPPAG